MTQLCAIPGCRIRGRHLPDCDGDQCTGCLPRTTDEGLACDACMDRPAGHLAEISELTPDARLVAAGLVRRGDSSAGSNKPGSRSPRNDGATDTLDQIHNQLARACIRIATHRGTRYHVPCLTDCIKPSPSQAHCGACHTTFGGVSGFDRHRRDGQCLTPDAIGYTPDTRGVYRAPMTEAGRQRIAALADSRCDGEPQTAQNTSGVGRDTLDDHEPAETPAA